ncbi:MAG: Flp pilus assembly complex ATPase component TadA [Myxococcales bacterium]|nr:Flp pilus assembly complex ATPase component TadA [Myxococcales bacterium]
MADLGAGRRGALEPTAIADFLASSALFKACDRQVVDRIAPHVEAIEVDGGTIVSRAGSAEPLLGIVYAGKLAVRSVNAISGASTVLEEIRVGDSFGEVGAVLGTAQATEVVADQKCIVVLLNKDLLAQMLAKVAPFAAAIAKRLATRVVMASVANIRGQGAPGATGAAADAPLLDLQISAPPPAAAAHADGITFCRIASYPVDQKLISLVPSKLIHQHRMLPLELRGRNMLLGMVDPYNQASLGEIKRVLSNVDIRVMAIGLEDFNETIVRFRIEAGPPKARGADLTNPDTIQYDIADSEREAKNAVGVIGDEVVQLASKIIAGALNVGASDVHIETDGTGVRVRFRTSGALQDWDQFVPASFGKSLVARFKVLAGLDITERRLPQDGRIGMRIGKREVDARISTLPASRGEKIVMRMFEASSVSRPLEAIIADANALASFRNSINRPYGAIIIAGPTGSGKSSTLYAALGERKRMRADTSIVTVEDPIEYRLQGITQTQVNHVADLTFGRVLRAMLRQDPDIIMVGESRDPETAQLALEAAMTGHLLFTSLHANNAIGVIQRLEQLGCSRPLIAQALGSVLVQRLARKLCQKCVTSEVPPPLLLESLAARGLVEKAAAIPLPRATGCADCGQTGYSGRVAVIELLSPTDQLRALIMTNAPLAEIENVAAESGALMPFRRYASFLMSRQLLTPTEALLVVA